MTTTTDLTIRPFEVHVPEEDLADLLQWIAAWRPPELLPALRALWEPEMGANVFSRPQTQRDVARFFSQIRGSPFDSVRRWQTPQNSLTRKRSLVQIQYGPPGQRPHAQLSHRLVAQMTAEVMSLGAKVLKPAEDRSPESHDNYQVYADPAGHPFCLCWLIR